MTQSDLGFLAGLDPTTISRWEQGRVDDPKAAQVIRLARVLRVTADYLLGLDIPHEKTEIEQSDDSDEEWNPF